MKWSHEYEPESRDRAFRPTLLKMLREAYGYNQQELGAKLGFAQGTISKIENGLLNPSDDQVGQLARVFGVLEDFFQRSDPLAGDGPGEIYHRKRATSQKALTRLHARMNILAIAVSDLLSLVESDVLPIPRIEEFEFEEIPEIASSLRKFLRLPEGPIESVSEVMFSMGIILVPMDFEGARLDASAWIRPSQPPIVFYSPSVPDDRLRFTLMHELGHLVLHCGVHLRTDPKQVEEEAHYFASCFLLPPEEIAPQLTGLSLAKLGRLKKQWKVSMQALLYASKRHGSISDWRQRQLWEEMTRLGYRSREPKQYDVKCENPSRAFDELISLFKDQLRFDASDYEKLTKHEAHKLESLLGESLGVKNSNLIGFPGSFG